MAEIQNTTGTCFKKLYDFVNSHFAMDSELHSTLFLEIHKAERHVILELIKRQAVESTLTERVLKYSEEIDGMDGLTGLRTGSM